VHCRSRCQPLLLTTEICTSNFFLPGGRTDDAIPLYFWQGVIMMNLGLITSNYSLEKGIIFLTVLEKVCTHFFGRFCIWRQICSTHPAHTFLRPCFLMCCNCWLPSPKGCSQFTYDVAVTVNQPSVLSFVCMIPAVAGQLMWSLVPLSSLLLKQQTHNLSYLWHLEHKHFTGICESMSDCGLPQ